MTEIKSLEENYYAQALTIPKENHKIIDRVYEEVKPYTMAPKAAVASTIQLAFDVIDAETPGMLVECGTWKGGCSFAMLLAQQYKYGEIKKHVVMMDSFEGMGKPDIADGKMAANWANFVKKYPNNPNHFNNCSASLEEVQDAAIKLGMGGYCSLRKGWFEETVPAFQKTITTGDIALLRIDCDWYSPCKTVLKHLVPDVSIGGVIIIDDYYVWPGCTRATHEYLVATERPYRIRSAIDGCGAYMIKERFNG
jgi:O-methyltransferase